MTILSRRVSVEFYFFIWVYILKFVLVPHAMSAPDSVFMVFFCLFGHLAYANPADVVFAARTDQHCVKVHKADRAAVLINVRLVRVKSLDPLDLFFAYVSLDTHFVAGAYLVQVDWKVFFLDLVY